MAKQVRMISKKPVEKQELKEPPVSEKPKQIQLADLTDAQLFATIYQQEDTVARLSHELNLQQQKLSVIHAEGRKRAKSAEGAK